MTHYLEFEKPLAEIEGKAEELRAMARQPERHAAAARVVRMDARDGRIVRAPCAPRASRRHGVDRAAKERLRFVAGY